MLTTDKVICAVLATWFFGCGDPSPDVLIEFGRDSTAVRLRITLCESDPVNLDCGAEATVFADDDVEVERTAGIRVEDSFESSELQILFLMTAPVPLSFTRCDATLIDLSKTPTTVRVTLRDSDEAPIFDCIASGTCSEPHSCEVSL